MFGTKLPFLKPKRNVFNHILEGSNALKKKSIKKKKENNVNPMSFSFSLTLKFNYEKTNPY